MVDVTTVGPKPKRSNKLGKKSKIYLEKLAYLSFSQVPKFCLIASFALWIVQLRLQHTKIRSNLFEIWAYMILLSRDLVNYFYVGIGL